MGLIKRSFMDARPVEVGKIKIGTRGQPRSTSGGNTMYLPERLDHFLVTTMEREGKEGPFLRDEAVHGHPDVGDEPRELNGTLMYPEVEDNLHTEMCVYAGRRRQWTCDGECRITREGKEEPCQHPTCGCKPYARLHIQLDAQPNMGGFYVFRTHGWSSTNNLQTALEQIHREFGTLYRAPVRLFMQQTEDVYVQNGQEKTGRSWKVGLVLRMSPEEARVFLTSQAQAAIATREQLRLESGAVRRDLDATDETEEAAMADEFRPPVGVTASVKTAEALDAATAALAADPVPEAPQAPEEAPAPAQDAQEPVEADYEVVNDEPSLADEVRALREKAKAAGFKMTAAQEKKVAEALFVQAHDQLEQTKMWLEEKIAESQQGGLGI